MDEMTREERAEILEVARQIQAGEEERKRPTRERHARERLSRSPLAGAPSREALRKFMRVREAAEAGGWLPQFMAWARSDARKVNGRKMSINEWYERVVAEDERRPLSVKLDLDLYHAIDILSEQQGVTKSALVEALLREQLQEQGR